ncbi:hypothetical protein U8C31_18215 [Sinorhizobium medicae]|uniref:hypothetical protein n=1 Tax=Sinorhizobium medicae TaxID=110321 RepID=UPI002AF6B223|nr:hypothetical protein [Sinorhizobium medicae]WQO72172.1 hypothetical protein U8C31_18215 [Sinorhizobium medicae]
MVQTDAFAVELDFGIVSGRLVPCQATDGFPWLPVAVEIVIAQDQALPTLETVENLLGTSFVVTGKVTQVPDDVVWFHNRIPDVDQEFVHLIRGRERPEFEHESMPKMLVSSKIVVRKRHGEVLSEHNKSRPPVFERMDNAAAS